MQANESSGDWRDYLVTAQRSSGDKENKIHSDDVARSLGFSGGLVGGTTVYSYMTHRLVERFGESWLGGGSSELTLFKPAYDGDALTMRTSAAEQEAESDCVLALNGEGTELARLETRLAAPPPLNAMAEIPPTPRPEGAEKPLVSWEGVVPGDPFWPMNWQPSQQENLAWSEAVKDPLPIYREGESPPLHPGLILQAANNVFKERFLLPAWIHTASRIVTRSVMRAGQAIEVRAIPVEKYEKKGHQIVDLYVIMLAEGEPAMEVRHKAIFKVREAT
jgi:hypothetical protein